MEGMDPSGTTNGSENSLMGQVVGPVVSILLERVCAILESLDSSSGCTSNSSFLQSTTCEAALPTTGETQVEFWAPGFLLAELQL